MAAIFQYRHRVTYSDCTVGNHIYYARYLNLLEAARGEFLRSLGHSFLNFQHEGIIFPVIELHLRYKGAARYDDQILIGLRVTRLQGVRLNFGCEIRKEAGTLLLEGETFHACTDMEDKPRRLPESLKTALQPYLAQDSPKAAMDAAPRGIVT